MLNVNTGKWFQVVEYTCAKQIIYFAGMGQRREDGDNLLVYPEREMSFYVRKDTTQSPLARLAVDEGSYTNAMHLPSIIHPDNVETTNTFSLPWCEYVDAGHLMGTVVRKLVPDATMRASEAIGRGRRQQDAMDQYIAHLLAWTERNPKHSLRFI
jgi:hypothetical protein